jgi:hypothetical protein
MFEMRNLKSGLVGVFALFGMFGTHVASALVLTSADADCSAQLGDPSQNNVEAAFQLACATGDATQLYKSDFRRGYTSGANTGSFASSYITTFDWLESAGDDPGRALIRYVYEQLAISGFDRLFVLAKDGNHDPSYYGWDISGWNGTEVLDIQAWNNIQGAISNVSIWGSRSVSVPEPGALSLLGLGLLGLGLSRRRRKANA